MRIASAECAVRTYMDVVFLRERTTIHSDPVPPAVERAVIRPSNFVHERRVVMMMGRLNTNQPLSWCDLGILAVFGCSAFREDISNTHKYVYVCFLSSIDRFATLAEEKRQVESRARRLLRSDRYRGY